MSSHFSRLKQFFKVLAITAAWSTGFSVLTTAQVVNQIGPDPLTKEGIQEISQILPLAELNQPESDQPVKTAQTIIPSVALWEKRSKAQKANIVVPNNSGRNQWREISQPFKNRNQVNHQAYRTPRQIFRSV